MQDFRLAHEVFGNDFLYERHIGYLLKSIRKSPIDATEAHRLSNLFFVVSGLDLLGALDTQLSRSDKQDIIEWIYSYQVDVNRVKLPYDNDYDTNQLHDIKTRRMGHSGFRATSVINNDFPSDCGILTMTYCALATLVMLGDDLRRVDRKSIIAGMRQLQLPDGSFKPSVLGGESDLRLVYCAASVSRLLNDWSGIDRDKCAKFVKDSLSYEGAFAQCPGAEAHGGSTYCALASLKLMSKFDDIMSEEEIDRLVRWCMNRLDRGFSGRPNKDEDTCYSFWIGACLVMLDHFKYVEQKNILEFILMAQEERGGLSKVPAFYSDPLHTHLGFAGLTFIDDDLCAKRQINLLKLDPTLNITLRARSFLDKLHESWSRSNSINELAPKIKTSPPDKEFNGDEEHSEEM